MAIPISVPRIYVSMGGNLPGSEQWQVGFWFDAQQAGTPDSAALGAWLASAQTAVQNAFVSYLRPLISSGSNWNRTRAYFYPSGATSAAFIADGPAVNAVGSGGQTMPNQTALVASLRSDIAGRQNRGRVYWPLLAGSTPGPQVEQAVCTQLANGIADVLSAYQGVSIAGGTVLAAVNANVPVVRVEVDSIPDTQRRRRNKLTPQFRQSIPLVVG